MKVSSNLSTSNNNLKKSGTKRISQKKSDFSEARSIDKSKSRSKSEKNLRSNKTNSSNKLISKNTQQLQKANKKNVNESYEIKTSNDNMRK